MTTLAKIIIVYGLVIALYRFICMFKADDISERIVSFIKLIDKILIIYMLWIAYI